MFFLGDGDLLPLLSLSLLLLPLLGERDDSFIDFSASLSLLPIIRAGLVYSSGSVYWPFSKFDLKLARKGSLQS